MAIDTPARIAIVGAGPIGLEAALYGRFLGYEVDVFERGKVADSISKWGHVQLFSPWSMNTTPLGRTALETQNPDWKCPADDLLPTGNELVENYLLPLAQSDLIVDGLHEQTEVLKIGREDLLKGECVGDEPGGDKHRADTLFRLLVRSSDGQERVQHADIVIDASGTFGNHNALGVGGLPALGEIASVANIHYGLPDIGAVDREKFAGSHTLVVGSGYSAATNVIAIAALARENSATRITWVTRGENQDSPIKQIEEDRLAARAALTEEANQLAADSDSCVEHFAATSVERITGAVEEFEVQLIGEHADKILVDQIIANVGYRPDQGIYSELQVHSCYATDGPMKLAAAMLGKSSVDCLDQITTGPEALFNPEPNFYILGAKSYGRNSNFLIAAGHAQIRDLFTIIGDRVDLDLYQEPKPKLG
jgi:thioredoxin reductase